MPFFGVPIRNGLPIGLGSVAGFGVQQFDPSQLFEGGTVAGAWYDPSDLSTMFDTSAGTTPVAMPGLGAAVPVGAMLDKRATGYSVFFDGSNDNLQTPSSAAFTLGSSDDFTIECWTYLLGLSGNYAPFATTWVSTGGVDYQNRWNLGFANNRIAWFDSAGNTAIQTAGSPTLNVWTHLAVVGLGSTITLYVNGSSVGTQTTNRAYTTQGGLSCGAVAGGGSINGYISNLRVVKGTAVYTGNFTPPTVPLSPISGTSLLTCGTAWSGNPAITTVGNTRVDGLNPFTASPTGNHAIAFNNTTARPELRARVNLLTYSEDFSNAAWLTFGGASKISTNAIRLTSAGTASNVYQQFTAAETNASSYVFSVEVMRNAGSNQTFQLFSNLRGTQQSSGDLTATDTWQRFSITGTYSSGATGSVFGIIGNTAGTQADLLVRNADLRPANIGANVPAYQRIADANTYDTSGFPLYLRFDGIDDSMYTPANLNLSGTDKVAVFAGVRQTAAGNQQLVEFSADVNANNGAFSMPKDAVAAAVWTIGLRGTSATSASSPANYAAPITTVNAGLYDIGLSTDEAKLRINGAQVATSGAGSAGTGNFGTYPLYIGSRANSTVWFNGHLYSLAVVGSAVSGGNIAAMESWVAGRTGIQI